MSANAKHAHQELQDAIVANLQPRIEQTLVDFGAAGLAIGIVRDKTLVYAQGFGVRNVDTQEAVTPESLFHLASISKPFVATAIMQLVERGLVELSAPVVTYLPYFKLDDERYRAITVQQMLNHTAGMPNVWDYDWYAPEVDEGALERYVRGLAHEKLLSTPGEEYEYSNVAFEVLGDVIAKVSGQSFEAYIQEHILTPLGMHASTFLRHEVPSALATTPHFGMPAMTLGDAYPYHRAHAPSSTLHSNVIEMSHWAIANLNRGELDGARILQPESYDQLWHRYVETGEEVWMEAVGLSWFLGTYGGLQNIQHGGSDPGFGAELVLIPDRGDAVIVAANSNSAASAVVLDATLDLLLGIESPARKPSCVIPLARILKTEGVEAAVTAYQHMHATMPDSYDFGMGRFMDVVWGAIETHNPESVMDILRLWLTVQPDEAEAHEMMGWAHQLMGNHDAAVEHVRRALELDPENTHAAVILKQLSGAG